MTETWPWRALMVILVIAGAWFGFPAGHIIMITVVILAVAALLTWRHHARRHHLRRHRVRHLRIRLHLRLHPGPGHASGWELLTAWGRLAAWRESRRVRPSLAKRPLYRWRHPGEHARMVGRAHHFRRVWISVQEHFGLMGPPRAWKTALLAWLIIWHRGPVVVTSSKPDLYRLTAAVRHLLYGSPVWSFNPTDIGGIGSNVHWSPLSGCKDTSVAIRRGNAFAQAVGTEGTDDAVFWSRTAAAGLRGIFHSAALAGRDMYAVSGMTGDGAAAAEGVKILRSVGLGGWAAKLAELFSGAAEKTSATVRIVMNDAVSFMEDPSLAAAVLPAPGQEFSIGEFLASGGTLYMLSRSDQQETPLAAPFAALAAEIHHEAISQAGRMPGGRLDPPLFMALDEVTQICPVPLPFWLADSGGQGVSVAYTCHGEAQLVQRWKTAGAQTVLNTTNVRVIVPGLADADTLSSLSKLLGQHGLRDGERNVQADVMDIAMIRRMPKQFALLIRGAQAPVIVKLAMGWKARPYRKLKRHDRHEWELAQAARASAVQAGAVPAAVVQPVPEPVPEPVPALAGASREWSPSDVIAAQVNGSGNGHAPPPPDDDASPWWADQ